MTTGRSESSEDRKLIWEGSTVTTTSAATRQQQQQRQIW